MSPRSPRLESPKSCLLPSTSSNSDMRNYNKLGANNTITNSRNYNTIEASDLTDPHKAHDKSTSLSAFFHIVCVMAGTGILQLPYALKLGGGLGILWIFISGILAYFSGKFLVNCLYFDGLNRLNGIIEVSSVALGKNGRRITEFSYFSLIIGASGLYLILATNNLVILDQWTGLKEHEWVIICFLVSCIPFIAIKSLKEATYLSLFGVATTVAMVLVIIVVSFQDYTRDGSEIKKSRELDYQWVNWTYLPLSLASISFSFGGNTVFPHVEKTMKNNKEFNMVLKSALTFISLIYAAIAAVGYLAYAQDTKSPILNNLHLGDAVLVAMAMLTLHVLVTIPINMTALALDAEFALGLNSSSMSVGKQTGYRYLFRTFLSLLTLALAVYIPYFDHVMALLGALSNSILVFLLPPIFYIKLFGWRNIASLDKTMAVILMVVGSFVVVIGTCEATVALWHDVFPN